ncbi:hypothetical protein RC083_02265 [Pseudoalteromonas haloplanktis]|uniref:Uncharacterized protein n=1 Tax=Pseudoalteromonas haloplanktis TaxID=228 RepID=A0ABU1B912_PSEHA|nr:MULTISPECIES: hypothetical protein [Pseudoalteromonas]MDQ9090414.1 hypothetical protein [Pseudoalteromonas haloplanktis]TMN72499.1 hypothetical protein CWB85_06740 [Pseudoalteromonas sp. S1727]
MSAHIQSIFKHDQHLATVSGIDSFGRIKAVVINDIEYSIVAQGAHVSTAEIGANVLLAHTGQGFIVTALLAQPDQAPAAQINNAQGHIVIAAQQSVSLQTAKGSIEVFADGTIVLEGQDITANSEQDLTLAGWPIRLN